MFIYHIKLNRQDVRDESQHCKNYPKDATYAKCDDKFVRDSLNTMVGPDYSPIWADKKSKAAFCLKPNMTNNVQVQNLLSGNKENKCPLPCTTTRVKSVFNFQNEDGLDDFGQNIVSIVFQQRYV